MYRDFVLCARTRFRKEVSEDFQYAISERGTVDMRLEGVESFEGRFGVSDRPHSKGRSQELKAYSGEFFEVLVAVVDKISFLLSVAVREIIIRRDVVRLDLVDDSRDASCDAVSHLGPEGGHLLGVVH